MNPLIKLWIMKDRYDNDMYHLYIKTNPRVHYRYHICAIHGDMISDLIEEPFRSDVTSLEPGDELPIKIDITEL